MICKSIDELNGMSTKWWMLGKYTSVHCGDGMDIQMYKYSYTTTALPLLTHSKSINII
jgi:hypothetical protein